MADPQNPSPRKGEKKKDFMSRCMKDRESRRTFPKRGQRFKFCESQWERKKNSIMSAKGIGISLKEATEISNEWIDKFTPLCHRVSSAGTVRRADEETAHDVDLVVIRDDSKLKEWKELIDSLEYVLGKADGKWILRKLENGVILDVKMCTDSDWGWRLFQHTGPTDLFLFTKDKLSGVDKDFSEEKDVFNALGINYIIPRNRFCEASWQDKSKENKMNWIQKLRQSKKLGEVTCEVVEVKDDKHPEKKNKKVGKMSIRGFIGRGMFQDGVTDSAVERILNEMGTVDEVEVVINSGGGSVFDAFAIFSQLRKFPAKIVTIIEGVAASAAAFLAEAGDVRFMSGNALFMIHKASGIGSGDQDVIAKLLDVLKKVDGILENTFVKASTSTLEAVRGFMTAEEFMTANQAKERGFIDEIGPESDAVPHAKPKEEDKDTEDAIKSIMEKLEKDFRDSKPLRTKWQTLVEEISAGIPSKPANKKTSTKSEEAEMVATELLKKIQNVLNIEESDQVLESIEDIQKQLKEKKAVTNVTNVTGELLSLDTDVEDRLVAVEKKQKELEKENKSLKDQRDLAVSQMDGVITFKNDEILKQRRKAVQALFDQPVCKINPAQLKDALSTFVDIEPDQVEDTQTLYDHSIKVWNLNATDKSQLSELKGSNEVDDTTDPDNATPGESAESIGKKIEAAVLAHKDANKCSYEEAEKAVEISHKALHDAYEKAMAK